MLIEKPPRGVQSAISNQQSAIFFPHKQPNYLGHVPADSFLRYINFMSTGTGSAPYKCAQCDQPEGSCDCEKFCCLCQAVIDIRVCADGLMYCDDCRKACDYKTSD